MFIRWKARTLRKPGSSGLETRSLYAVLVESRRVEGRPRQKVVKYLAHLNEDQKHDDEHRRLFWERVDEKLATLSLAPRERTEIEEKLSEVIARPGTPEHLSNNGHTPPTGASVPQE